MAEPECRTMLFSKRTCSIVVHGAAPCARTVNRIAKPDWSSSQLFSITLPSIWTLRAFFSSSRFFTIQVRPVSFRGGTWIDRRNRAAEEDPDGCGLDVVVL